MPRKGLRAEVSRIVHEYLTASMIMVPLDEPLDERMLAGDARDYLDEREYDLALLHTPEVRVLYRERLKSLSANAIDRPAKAYSVPPRFDRLIEHTLELGAVASRLKRDGTPLLVVGRDGPEFIVTRSDFTRPAGQMGIIAVIAALDAYMDELLSPHDKQAEQHLTDDERNHVDVEGEKAKGRSEEVRRLSYLTLGSRLRLARELELAVKLDVDLGSQNDHDTIVSVRNDIAHGREVPSGLRAIEALMSAERILQALDSGLRQSD